MPKQSASQIEAIEHQQQNIVETYNGEPVHEYSFARPRGDDGRLALRKNSLRKRVHSVRAFFAEVFLPQGYPATVSADYLDYQLYDTLQAFASSLNGTLATLAVLKGVGVGNEQATVLAAALTWILKDGVGMLARIAFAWAKGTRLDSDCKRWRLFADLLNDASFFIITPMIRLIAFFGLITPISFYDLINPHFPSACFAPFACVASLLRSIVGVAGGATRMAIIRHQARRDNLADVAAKDGSQETLVNVLSLLFSLVLLPQVEGRPFTIWALFLLFTAVHLFANYRAVKCIQLETLNPNRLTLAVRREPVGAVRVFDVAACFRAPPAFRAQARACGEKKKGADAPKGIGAQNVAGRPFTPGVCFAEERSTCAKLALLLICTFDWTNMTYSPSKFPWVPVPNCVCPNLDNECLRPAPYTRPILCVNKVIKNITYFLATGGELEPGGGSSPSAGGCSPPLAIALYVCSMFLILILFYVAFCCARGRSNEYIVADNVDNGPVRLARAVAPRVAFRIAARRRPAAPAP
ncbi:hypothetical protein niasHT_012958 [Heterodera trifolii]|uniref:Protein root UVB sensitive/RUS domain-containing protein n=1 Tax=Heterodera trifolii TaxID=157864 RepID=A0ABD2L8J5_9BILA